MRLTLSVFFVAFNLLCNCRLALSSTFASVVVDGVVGVNYNDFASSGKASVNKSQVEF